MDDFNFFSCLLIILVLLIICSISRITIFTANEEHNAREKFGALQSLYSNDGIQDAQLTLENDPDYFYDPYAYWRSIGWNLPTRNLGAIAYYPYLYEHNVDRYGTLYPYWSL